MKPSFVITKTLLLSVTMGVMGCGGGGPSLHPVSGKITGAKGSLEGVLIVLNPLDSKGFSAMGEIGADGTFKVESNNDRAGAAVGKYKVTLAPGTKSMQKMMEGMATSGAKSQPGPSPRGGMQMGPPKIEKPFPEEYSLPTTSPKEFEVKPGKNVLDIAL